MKTHKFARRPFYVDAVRVSETNIGEVAAWCGGEILTSDNEGPYIKVEVHRPLTPRQTQAFYGCWVLRSSNGFKVYEAKAFDKSFEKVKTLTKAQADAAGITVPHEPRAPKGPIPTPPRQKEEVRKPFSIPPAVLPKDVELLSGIDVVFTQKGTGATTTLNSEKDMIAGHVIRCHQLRGGPDWVCSCSETPPAEPEAEAACVEEAPAELDPADVEAEKLINEVLRDR